MKCPVCNDVRMREVEKNGVLLDVCPECKGVWLDRGELEKLMSEVREVRRDFNEWYDERERRTPPSGYDQYGHDSKDSYDYKRKKKKNPLDILGDLFD